MIRAALIALALAAGCTRANHEDDAYDLAKTAAKKDLACDDVTVKKMGQTGDAYEYEATGCNDIYSYGIDCDGKCVVAAGVRGPGIAGSWSKSTSLFDKFLGDFEKKSAEMDREHDASRARAERIEAEIDAKQKAMDERIERNQAQLDRDIARSRFGVAAGGTQP